MGLRSTEGQITLWKSPGRPFLFLLALIALEAVATAQSFTITAVSKHILTNESVIQLAKAGFDELFIVERIRASRTRFDTSVEGLIALKQAGLSEDLIRWVTAYDRSGVGPPPQIGSQSMPMGESGPPIAQIVVTDRSIGTSPKRELPRPDHAVVEKHWWGVRWFNVPD